MINIKNKIVLVTVTSMFVASAAMAASAPAPQHTLQLLRAVAGDQVPHHLVGAEAVKIAMDHAPVQVSWALPAAQKLEARPQPFKGTSRHYLIDATGTQLQRGVAIHLTAPGALLLVSPRGQGSAPLNATQVHVRAHGRRRAAAQISSAVSGGQPMVRPGMLTQRGSIAMHLDNAVGAGTVHLEASGARGHYVVQVNEPQSPFALTLAADHDTRLAGQTLELHTRLLQPGKSASVDAVSGVLEAPDGWSTDIDFAPRPDHSYVASVTPPAAHAGQRGLWQVHVFASGHDGQQELLRDATNAFAAVLPTARLDGLLVRQPGAVGQEMDFDIGIDAGAASRYAVSAVLYGHNSNGQLRPAVYAQSANWLTPGQGRSISLRFDAAAVAKSGMKPPFELHDLRLEDQVQLGVLERRQIAARDLAAQ